ncbi:uncharacterized protein LOC109860452 [Pseudomyrmex gracilis]|uniref:uncharacterized protein LOC109860452 n=1 Tax=Pseudomyrmex gracilis TaxID=219809 RepID=UPI000994BFBE|nr:uncharacterized protein LOC109860452 [Pseudomyrmex gracilis]
MSDIKDALLSLCKYIASLTNVNLTPEHLRLAKDNYPDKNAEETLWSTLHVLSYFSASEKRSDVDFRDYDTQLAVKLHFAFLQYPTIEFYGLSRGGSRNRDLLIALAWLLAKQDCLNVVFRTKLINSVLGAECSHEDSLETAPLNLSTNQSLSTSDLLDNILHLNAKVNLNLKEISELIREQGRLICRVHAASVNVSGLPHLNVSELALTKRLVTNVINDASVNPEEKNRQKLREFHKIGILLETRVKWLRKQHVFFDWMATVVQDHKKFKESPNPGRIDLQELAAFSSLLCRIIEEKLQGFASASNKSQNLALDCSSRTHKIQGNNSEAAKWLDDLNERQNRAEENLQQNRKRLFDELERMLNLIPSTVRV